MTLKTFSDKAKTFTFTYYFCDQATAQVAGHALLGYMTGTYCQPVISLTYKDKGTLVAEYVEDHKLNKTFKRIGNSLSFWTSTLRFSFFYFIIEAFILFKKLRALQNNLVTLVAYFIFYLDT